MVGFVKFAPPKRRLTWCLIRSNFGMKIDEYPRMNLKTSLRLTVLQLIVFIHYVSKSVISRAKVPLLSRAGRRRDGASRAHYTRYCFAIRFLDFRYERPLPVSLRSHRADKDMAECCLQSNKGSLIQYSCHGDKRRPFARKIPIIVQDFLNLNLNAILCSLQR